MDMKTILIIEDEPTINRILAKYFLKEGYTVLSALDGAKGLELFQKNHIDIICLDIMLPNITGWKIAQTIRETSDVPIIMMSALGEEEDILKGFSLQVDDYITKPFPPRVLLAKINNFFKRIEIERNQQKIDGVYNIEGINFEVSSLEQNEVLKDLLTHDELTKVANRRYLDLHLKSMIQKAKDFNMDFGVLFIDIDDFKIVNDTYGHNIGDEVLHKVASIISNNLRSNDLIGRWGGEEFIVVINISSKQILKLIAEKLRQVVSAYEFSNNDEKFHITISIGGVMYQSEETNEELVNRADELMYEAKRTGKNKVVIK